MASRIPATFRKIVVQQLTYSFKEAVKVVEVPVPRPGPNEILVRNRFVGINASDINFTAGKYDPTKKPPFDCGFEGVGEVVSVGNPCQFQVGQAVAYMQNGAFAEYVLLNAKRVFPLPNLKAEYVPLLVSGLTAAISLDKIGQIKNKETVLVTAAAGGAGQFAVQLAKNAGCHVIGTCSSQEKVNFLKDIGCDRTVNYKEEKLHEVLKSEYPRGVDVVFESVGADIFDAAVQSLAMHGRLIVIGYIAGYQSKKGFPVSRTAATLPQRLLPKSASVRGFFLFNHFKDAGPALLKLTELYTSGKLKSVVDTGEKHTTGPFVNGLDSIPNAVEYLYTGKNIGKIVVEFPSDTKSKL